MKSHAHTVNAICDRLRSRGAVLETDGQTLDIRLPGRLTVDEASVLRQHKAAIIEQLMSEKAAEPPATDAPMDPGKLPEHEDGVDQPGEGEPHDQVQALGDQGEAHALGMDVQARQEHDLDPDLPTRDYPALVAALYPTWQYDYAERAGIMEHDGCLPRAEAEKRAFAWLLGRVEMLSGEPGAELARASREGAAEAHADGAAGKASGASRVYKLLDLDALTKSRPDGAARVIRFREGMAKGIDYDIYIGHRNPRFGLAESPWANPFYREAKKSPEQRREAIEKYREHVLSRPDLLARLPELRGKVLACWCAPLPCHGDVLVELLRTNNGTIAAEDRPELWDLKSESLDLCSICGHETAWDHLFEKDPDTDHPQTWQICRQCDVARWERMHPGQRVLPLQPVHTEFCEQCNRRVRAHDLFAIPLSGNRVLVTCRECDAAWQARRARNTCAFIQQI